MKYHPDKNAGDKEAEKTFQQLQEAKEILCNPEKRSLYDKWKNSGLQISYKNWIGMKEHVVSALEKLNRIKFYIKSFFVVKATIHALGEPEDQRSHAARDRWNKFAATRDRKSLNEAGQWGRCRIILRVKFCSLNQMFCTFFPQDGGTHEGSTVGVAVCKWRDNWNWEVVFCLFSQEAIAKSCLKKKVYAFENVFMA